MRRRSDSEADDRCAVSKNRDVLPARVGGNRGDAVGVEGIVCFTNGEREHS